MVVWMAEGWVRVLAWVAVVDSRVSMTGSERNVVAMVVLWVIQAVRDAMANAAS